MPSLRLLSRLFSNFYHDLIRHQLAQFRIGTGPAVLGYCLRTEYYNCTFELYANNVTCSQVKISIQIYSP